MILLAGDCVCQDRLVFGVNQGRIRDQPVGGDPLREDRRPKTIQLKPHSSQVAAALGHKPIRQLRNFPCHRQPFQPLLRNPSVGGLIICAAGAALAAPAVAAAIGSAAGLSGAAATSHGLALLGGGSLAVGGYGMAGGMWVLTGAGAATGILSGGGSALLLNIGAPAAKIELVKLQVHYKEVLLEKYDPVEKAQEMIASLVSQRDEIERELERERELNDGGSTRLSNIASTLRGLEDCIHWMEMQEAV